MTMHGPAHRGGKVRIGVSGWRYDSWRGTFYPEDLPRAEELSHAARCFDTLEINGSFYSLRKPREYRAWYEAVPRGFRFAVKGSRFITHNKRLKGVRTALANFFASGVLRLDEKLGPILWQLSARFRFDDERVASFLRLLPGDTDEAGRLARAHDDRVAEASPSPPRRRHRLRHVLEPRHESFLVPEMARLARRHGVALAFSDARDWPYTEEITTGFVYLRLHGPGETYASSYSDRRLRRWASRLESWSSAEEPADARRITDRPPPRRKSRDVYVYFDNDHQGHAPRNAGTLIDLLSPSAEGRHRGDDEP
jgi:uncharacterized protein YecE (DUF72 family)